MNPAMFRKTLLALAITATALPAHADDTLVLTDAGLVQAADVYAGNLEIIGSFTSTNSGLNAVELHGIDVANDLILNATINANGEFADGVDMGMDDSTQTPNKIGGNLINKGSITIVGDGGAALLIASAQIGGSVINEGTLSVSGEPVDDNGHINPVRALDISGSTTLDGDVHNATTGRILAEGSHAKGISMAGGIIAGSLINDGLIQVTGSSATAIELTDNEKVNFAQPAELKSVINNGTIIARDDDAVGLYIDGARFVQDNDPHIVNTGTINAEGAAIAIARTIVDGQTVSTPLVIVNSGTLISRDKAIDASDATRPIHLRLQDGSKVTGNLIDLSDIEISGNVVFNGTDSTSDGANIRMKNGGEVYVGYEYGLGPMPAHLELGQAHTSIDGNLYVAENSSLGMTLSPVTDAGKAVLSISGRAEFEQGSQIKLGASGSDFKANGTTYTLIEAGTLNDNGLSVISSSALLTVDLFKAENNEVVAQVSTKNNDQLGELINSQGGNNNSLQALTSFSRDGLMSRMNVNDPLYQALANADAQQVAAIAAQMAPEINGGASQAATTSQSLINNTTSARIGSTRGLSSGETFKQTGVWVQSLYSDATQGQRDGVAGYNAYSRGIAVGADGKVNDQVTLGLAYSFLNTDVNGKIGNTTKVDSHAFTLYGGFEQGNYFADASLTYGLNDNEGKRKIAGTTAKADYDSTLLGLNLIGGYTYQINPQLLVEPRVAARYSLVDIDGYREKGSSAGLKVQDQRYEAIELGAGLRVAGHYPLGQGTLVPQAKLMAYHDFAADQVSSTSTFVLGNTPFVTTGAKAVRNSYEAGVGTDYKLGAATLGLNYDYVGKSGFDADTFTAKVRYDF